MTPPRKEMNDFSCQSAAIQVKRLADCTGDKASDLFETLVLHGVFNAQEAAEMAQYFNYDE